MDALGARPGAAAGALVRQRERRGAGARGGAGGGGLDRIRGVLGDIVDPLSADAKPDERGRFVERFLGQLWRAFVGGRTYGGDLVLPVRKNRTIFSFMRRRRLFGILLRRASIFQHGMRLAQGFKSIRGTFRFDFRESQLFVDLPRDVDAAGRGLLFTHAERSASAGLRRMFPGL